MRVRATIADPNKSCAPDLVKRNLRTADLDKLHPVGFIHGSMPGGFGYTAFVVDAYAGVNCEIVAPGQLRCGFAR